MTTAALRSWVARMPSLDRRHWLASLVLATMLLLYLIAGLNVAGMTGVDGRAVAKVTPDLPAAVRAEIQKSPTLPQPEPLEFRHVDPDDAVAFNASIPVSAGASPAAKAFVQRSSSAADRARALECLASAIYYEAATEPVEGQRAVAQVVLNRVRHPAFPNSVCGVVYQGSERATGCQFTFTCDGSLRRAPIAPYWQRAREVAEAALSGKVYAPVGYATHYHTNWVVPYWSSSLVKAANVGTHIFYRWSGGWGKPAAFVNRHSGDEPNLAPAARMAALSRTPGEGAEGTTDAMAAEAAEVVRLEEGSIDSFQRAVLRRYEPAKREGVAAVLAAQTGKGEAVASAHRWALTGDRPGGTQTPLGAKAEAAPAQPACLAGVKKSGAGEGEPAKPVSC